MRGSNVLLFDTYLLANSICAAAKQLPSLNLEKNFLTHLIFWTVAIEYAGILPFA
jgi:hypothetical protein